MNSYKKKIAPATQNGASHRRNHKLEREYLVGLTLEQIGVYLLVSNRIFEDEGPKVPFHDKGAMVKAALSAPNSVVSDMWMQSVGAEQCIAALDALIQNGIVYDFEGYFCTLAQNATFKRQKAS